MKVVFVWWPDRGMGKPIGRLACASSTVIAALRHIQLNLQDSLPSKVRQLRNLAMSFLLFKTVIYQAFFLFFLSIGVDHRTSEKVRVRLWLIDTSKKDTADKNYLTYWNIPIYIDSCGARSIWHMTHETSPYESWRIFRSIYLRIHVQHLQPVCTEIHTSTAYSVLPRSTPSSVRCSPTRYDHAICYKYSTTGRSEFYVQYAYHITYDRPSTYSRARVCPLTHDLQ